MRRKRFVRQLGLETVSVIIDECCPTIAAVMRHSRSTINAMPLHFPAAYPRLSATAACVCKRRLETEDKGATLFDVAYAQHYEEQ
eukprot:4257516-Amphidinium_carterae.1